MHLVWKSEAVRKQANQPKQVYLQIYKYITKWHKEKAAIYTHIRLGTLYLQRLSTREWKKQKAAHGTSPSGLVAVMKNLNEKWSDITVSHLTVHKAATRYKTLWTGDLHSVITLHLPWDLNLSLSSWLMYGWRAPKRRCAPPARSLLRCWTIRPTKNLIND